MPEFTKQKLAELRAVAEAATRGSRAVEGSRVTTAEGSTIGQAWGVNWKNDQRFMAEATPDTLLALIDALEAKTAEVERLTGQRDMMRRSADEWRGRTSVAKAALERVKAVHYREKYEEGPRALTYCYHCTDYVGLPEPWPCPTIQALQAIEGEEE